MASRVQGMRFDIIGVFMDGVDTGRVERPERRERARERDIYIYIYVYI